MPGSSEILDWALIRDLKEINPKTVWEAGCGRGRVGHLVKKTLPNVYLRGFEIFEQYVKDHHKTLKVYDEITISDVSQWTQDNVDWCVDVFLIPDMIEHLPLSKALDLIDNVQQRTRWLIIKTPLLYKQNTEFGNIKEAHICELPIGKMINYDIRKYIIEVGDTGWRMAYYLIKGWL